MEKRKISKLNIETSLLGFGCMRFPTKYGKIEEVEATKMLQLAYDSGVNYFDTAYVYHDGLSEVFTGKVLDTFPRDSYYLATKLPVWEVHKKEDVERLLDEQLSKLHKDYIDFYLLHALNGSRWDDMEKYEVYEACEEMRRKGKIRYIGFSFHDDYEAFEKIIKAKEWDFCQIQLNYMDTDIQAGMKGYKLAESMGIPMVIMEPIKGGNLAVLPEEIENIFKSKRANDSVASWALRWVASLPNIMTVLSGMSNLEQTEDNLNTFSNFEPMTEEENEVVKKAAETICSRVANGCTGCRYCMPCPAGVDIPKNFHIWNQYHMYMNKGGLGWMWYNEIEEAQKAHNCIKCGACEAVCPQKLSIRDDLEKMDKEIAEALK
ncbi:MAG: aldo/keto reductase [Lachnospiraceae bacterium]|nr:aldo/keto reductase [Lachnospiraceae bacterium]